MFDESSPAHGKVHFHANKDDKIVLGKATREDDHLPDGSYTLNDLHKEGHHVITGTILAATAKLLEAVPFNNSTILIVLADKIQGFHGLIINKRISWDIFREFDQQLQPLKQAPLFFGGPVRTDGLPLVSLARKAVGGYVKITSAIYYGDPVVTRSAIEWIKSGEHSANDFWFFLGYSSWGWNQLFYELAEGAWHVRESMTGNLEWPDT